MAKTTKISDLKFKTKLSAKEHQVLKNKVKKAKEAAKKAEAQIKVFTKQLAAAEKQLTKSVAMASKTKTAATKKAKINATDSVKKARAKLKLAMQISKERIDQVRVTEADLDMAERKEVAWKKAAAAFDKQWEREYDKKLKSSSPAKKVSKKASVKKAATSPKPALKLVVKKTESPVSQLNVNNSVPEPVKSVESVSMVAAVSEPKPTVYQSTEDTTPLNPLPFPSGFGQKNNEG
ncbi:MAG: hypothetical protein OEX19_13400 [Gammaproteobacteria bacterium]|nr:hypothetical protein [Gammaproteobacteria bacterium]